jgi:hypothetical protein
MDCYRVGRSGENDIVLNNVTVSRRHAEVRCRPDGLYDVVDLDSTVGSYVMMDGEWVQFSQATVEPHEPLRLGEHKATIARLIAGEDQLSRVNFRKNVEAAPDISRLATAGRAGKR